MPKPDAPIAKLQELLQANREPKDSKDGWGASRSGKCCTPSAKTRMCFFTRTLPGLCMMAACLIGWSKRGKPRSLLRRNDGNITKSLVVWRNCDLILCLSWI